MSSQASNITNYTSTAMRLICYAILSLLLLPVATAHAQDPTDAAPTPTDLEANVTSMFSNAYTDVAVSTWSADWDGASVEDVQVAGDDVKKYTITGWGVGVDFTGDNVIDASGHTHFRMDIWTPDDATVFRIKLVDFPVGATAFRSESEVVFDAAKGLTSGSWITLTIPLASMTELTSLAEIGQLILSGDGVSTVFVDNVMFFTSGDEPTVAAAAPAYPGDTVISMFSNAYTDVAVGTWSADWDGADVADVQVAGNDVKKYDITGWGIGIDFTGDNVIDASGHTNFRMDIWTPGDASVFRIKLVDFPVGASAFRSESEVIFVPSTGLRSGSWVTLDIPLADSLTELQSLAEIGQMILTGDGVSPLYIDNVMFYGGAGGPTPAGEEFIMFVNGASRAVETFDGTAVADPDDDDNIVAEFTYGAWGAPGFGTGSGGLDISAMVPATAGAGKTLYLRLRVDPGFNDAGALCEGNSDSGVGDPFTDVNSCLALSFFDFKDGGAATDDREGRMKWRIPAAMRDGAWHDLAIPMPPNTWDGLETAKAAAAPEDLIHYWAYAGGHTSEILGWGGVDASAPGPADPNWQDFQWDKIVKFGIHFDFANSKFDGLKAYLDNVYIGDENTVLGGIPPAAMTDVSFNAAAGYNEVTWTHNPDFGGYNVYWSLDGPVTKETILSGDATLLETVGADAAAFRAQHDFAIAHSTVGAVTLYYAVASLALDGTPNNDVSGSSGSVENPQLAIRPNIQVIEFADSDLIIDNLLNNIVSSDGFPAGRTFDVEGATLAPEDLSLKLRVAVDEQNVYFYAEVMDDDLSFISGGDLTLDAVTNAGNNAWNYDSVELGWGSYDVRDVVGGSALLGSPHINFANDTTPDYQFRLTAMSDVDGGSDIVGATAFFAADQPGSEPGEFGVPLGSLATAAPLTDGSGAVIGYKILAGFEFGSIAVSALNHSTFVIPGPDEIKLIPFDIALNDSPTGGTREDQVIWVGDGNWWNSPNQWNVVAVTGLNVGTDVEPIDGETPFTYELGQNYPNPFNPSTTVAFSLANAGKVNLEVFNVLGQKVATLIGGTTLTAGSHQVQFDAGHLSSGVYLVRLHAGSEFVKTRSMMLLK